MILKLHSLLVRLLLTLCLVLQISNVLTLIVVARENARHHLFVITDLKYWTTTVISTTSATLGVVINLQACVQNSKIVTQDATQIKNAWTSTFF